MRVVLTLLLMFLPFSLMAGDTGKAEISISQASYDFGTVYAGTKVEHFFEFKNSGSEPLTIKKVKGA